MEITEVAKTEIRIKELMTHGKNKGVWCGWNMEFEEGKEAGIPNN